MTDPLAYASRIAALRHVAECACGLVRLGYVPERRVGSVVHGALVCVADSTTPPPEVCRECGQPFNNANAHPTGLCAACRAGEEPCR